jgi:HSP20 family protein
MDAYRRGDEFIVRMDVPGVDRSTLDVTVDDNAVTVSAERHARREEDAELLISERPQGSFTRRFTLGTVVDSSRIDATYEDGVLTLTIPVSEAAKPRRIEVKGGAWSATPDSPALEDDAPSDPPDQGRPDESANLPPY